MSRKTIVSGFRDARTTEQSDHLVQYLEYVDQMPEIRKIKECSYRCLCLGDGDDVLDAGCGPGYDAIRLAGMVGRSGSVLGIDLNERMVRLAEELAAGQSLPVSFSIGDISHTGLPDASIDAVRIERTLQILGNPGQVLDELIRVLKPGGRLVAVEPDWDTFVTDPGNRETMRTFFGYCHAQFPDGSTGRKLHRYFMERGLLDVTIHPKPLVLHDFGSAARLLNMEQFLSAAEEKGVIPEAGSRLWMEELRSADEQDRFTFAGMIFIVSGRK